MQQNAVAYCRYFYSSRSITIKPYFFKITLFVIKLGVFVHFTPCILVYISVLLIHSPENRLTDFLQLIHSQENFEILVPKFWIFAIFLEIHSLELTVIGHSPLVIVVSAS